MDCPVCGKRCSRHINELGVWYNCRDHGFAGMFPVQLEPEQIPLPGEPTSQYQDSYDSAEMQ